MRPDTTATPCRPSRNPQGCYTPVISASASPMATKRGFAAAGALAWLILAVAAPRAVHAYDADGTEVAVSACGRVPNSLRAPTTLMEHALRAAAPQGRRDPCP